MRDRLGARFARWETKRYGWRGQAKSRWAWWIERRLFGFPNNEGGRRVFFGEPPT